MQEIIPAIPTEVIKGELTKEKKLRNTNKGHNEIYVIDCHNAPNTLREIGRLREITFRDSGGGTGMEADLDRFDYLEVPYQQLIVWDPDAERIIGGYRFILGKNARMMENGQPEITSAHMFHYSADFIDNFLPHTIELGRSFVVPDYQSSKAGAKALFALDNLWDGIAAIVMQYPDVMYLLGKMTIYRSYNRTARNLIFYYLWKHFGDKENLITPYHPVPEEENPEMVGLILRDEDTKLDYRNLKDAVHRLGCAIPPLVNSYMTISPSLKMFGTGINDEFGDIYDTGILICFNEMYDDKRLRHVLSYVQDTVARLKLRFPNIKDDTEDKLMRRWALRRARRYAAFQKKRERKLRRMSNSLEGN